MKKILSSVLLFGAAVSFAFAQTSTTTPVSSSNVSASAGLTPESSFYFFDKLTESLQELFAFTPEAKVKLQIAFVAERVAEAKAMLAESGDHSKGLDSVHTSIIDTVQKTAEIIKTEKAAGNDVTKLAKEANDEFDSEESDLSKSLSDAHKEIVDVKIESFKKLLEEAKVTKDEAKITDAEKALEDAKKSAEDFKDKKDEIKKSFQDEKRSIEEEMSKEDQEKDTMESENEDTEDVEDTDSVDSNKESENKVGVKLEIKNENRATSTLKVNTEVRDLKDVNGQEDGEDDVPDGRR
ncbi:MAG: DUF5667 domain-containing protein [Candidatus Paceibacterota bacterium]